jgi:exosortase
MTTAIESPTPRRLAPLAPLAAVAACLAWAFWPTFVDLVGTWNTNPQYSHGFLVPLFAAFLLYVRRDKLDPAALRPSLLGAPLLALGLAVRLAGGYGFVSLEALALIPCVAGLVLLLGGRAAWRWAWPAVLFLGFMIPLPFSMSLWLSGPLQRLATVTSTFIMQVLGMPALAEGNVILLNEQKIGIVEACSGLRMLMVFFALSTAVVLVTKRHWIDQVLILASAVPIALLSNLIRVTATGVMYEAGHSELAHAFFHDVAGWVMMPLALGMLWVELKVMSHLFIDAPAPAPAPVVPAPRRTAAPRQAAPRPRRAAKPAPRPKAAPPAPEPTMEPIASRSEPQA